MSRTNQRLNVSPPSKNDKEFKDYSSIIQQNFEDVYENLHSHDIVAEEPLGTDGSIGDIAIIDEIFKGNPHRMLAVKLNSGWHLTDLVHSSYAEMYENATPATVINLTTAGTFYKWITATQGLMSEEHDELSYVSPSSIKIGTHGAGIYTISVNFSGTGSNVVVIHGAVFLNGVIQNNLEFELKLGAADTVNASCVGLERLKYGDVVDFRFSCDTNTKTVSIAHLEFIMRRIAE